MPRKEIAIVEAGKTYLGVVEDNKDPERQCRCRIRVVNVHDGQNSEGQYEIETKNLPWAKPWKDLNGNASNVPDIGKVVVVVFEKAKQNSPEYIYSNHYNINLEKKMSALSEADYLSMKSMLFDHKTQIYVNDSEGLKIDHKFNNINITDKAIDVNLKDNFGKLSLGTPNATQRAVLGDNFMQWFDTFLDLIVQNSAFVGNFSAPVLCNSPLYSHISLYQELRDTKILSKNVFLVDNDYVKTQNRIADPTVGDKWESTVTKNELTKEVEVKYNSVTGASTTTFPGDSTQQPKNDGTTPTKDDNQKENTPVVKDINPDARTIIQLLNNKNYKLNNKPLELNLVAVRNQCLRSGDKFTDTFTDDLYVMWLSESKEWQVSKFKISTVSGKEFTLTREILDNGFSMIGRPTTPNQRRNELISKYLNKKISSKLAEAVFDPRSKAITLTPSQYQNSLQLVNSELVARPSATFLFYEDSSVNAPTFKPDNLSKPTLIEYPLVIGKGYPGGKNVGYWGMFGRQCFCTESELTEFVGICQKHVNAHANSFTYTLVTKNDWTKATENAIVNKNDPDTDPQTAADGGSEKKTAEVKEKPVGRPPELLDADDILAFQVYVNKNGEKIKEDGSWGQTTQAAWDKTKTTYLKRIGHVKNSTIRLCFARLYPYGKVTKGKDGKFIFESPFNNNKYAVALYENKRFFISDLLLNQGVVKGSYKDGCREMSAQIEGRNVVVKSLNSWDNIRKMLNEAQ